MTELSQQLSETQQHIAEQAQAEQEVEVELVYPEEEETVIELPVEAPAAETPVAEAVVEQPVVESTVEPEPVVEPAVEPAPVHEEPKPEEPKQEEQPQPAPKPAPKVPQQTSLFGTAVTDIRQAVSIGDRFLFQRELFGGSAEKLQQALSELNVLGSLDEALAAIDKYGWDKQSSTYELFVNVLRRRFQ